MKFEFFHLMPYRDLPPDFAERYNSVWVDVPSELFDPAKAHQMYNDGLDELEAAAAAGYDGICINEHHQNAYGLMPSPNLMAANLCRRTKDVAIVVLGNSIALYNPPTRVAEEFAMLDCISGGRLVAGFPVGTPMDDCFCYGANPSHLREKYYEAADVITQAWTRPEMFSYNGRYNQLRYINIWPRPIQQPHPPVWIPGGGSVETWEWCAEHNYVYCYLSYSGYKVGKTVLDGFWEEMDRQGKEFNPYHAGFLQLVAVSETDGQAEEYKESIEYFFKKCLHIHSGFGNPPGYRSVRSNNSQVANSTTQSREDQLREFTWTDYLEAGNVIVGGPQTVREHLTHAIKELKVGNLMLLLQFGDMPKELAMKNTELFAREVMPYVRDIWPGYETRWWPEGVANPNAPAPVAAW
jgi:alkanesulfonate monooxygenase SsuD/methylene tetrahydromethanopterin reductase-like flavin-dependent oxidoreductase (luciferase family)